VHLDDTNIEVELTISERSGIHKYQFPAAEYQIVLLDLIHCDNVLNAKIEKVSDTEIQDYRFSEAWETDQRLTFYIKTSHLFNEILLSPPLQGMPRARKTAFTINNLSNESVYIKKGLSVDDETGVLTNLDDEIVKHFFIKFIKNSSLKIFFLKIVVRIILHH